MSLLEVRDLTVSYGGLHANDGVDLDVEPGTIVGLIGPNGAGKTTFIDALTGFTPLARGTIRFDGRDVTGFTPDRRAMAGLTRTFQSLELFDDLTVRDNVLVAAERPRWHSLFADLVRPGRRDAQREERVDRALAHMGLTDDAEAMPNDLSHGRRKLVSVARALGARPRLLLLDEPAAGLDTAESELLGSRIRSLLDEPDISGEQMSVVLVDHDMNLVLNVCDRVYVLDFGCLIAEGTPTEIRADPAVVAAYLGTA